MPENGGGAQDWIIPCILIVHHPPHLEATPEWLSQSTRLVTCLIFLGLIINEAFAS